MGANMFLLIYMSCHIFIEIIQEVEVGVLGNFVLLHYF